MGKWRYRGRSSGLSRYFTHGGGSDRYWIYSRPGKINYKAKSVKHLALLVIASLLTISGVAASVAITIRGNNSTQDGVVSLGVGKAVATTCDTSTTVKTDTTSQYDDNYSDFILQRLDVYNVDPNCGGKSMNLVVKITGGSDVNLTCSLPASNSITYSQSTFTFATNVFTTSGSDIGCSTGAGTTIAYPVYMASIAATAVQIK